MTQGSRIHGFAALCLTVAIAGCGGLPRATGDVHEQASIPPGEKIAILWTLGSSTDVNVNYVLAFNGTQGEDYERCTNALIERTFGANGYVAWARKLRKDERPVVPPDVRYMLVLRNTSVRYTRSRRVSTSSPFSDVLLDVTGDLFDRKTGKRLWTAYNWLASDAKRNSITSVHLVRGLAADGYLNLKPEAVADYAGGRAKSDDEIQLGCP